MYTGTPYPSVNRCNGNHEDRPQVRFPPPHPHPYTHLHHETTHQPQASLPYYYALKELIQTIVSWLQTVDAEFAAWQRAAFPHSLLSHPADTAPVNTEETSTVVPPQSPNNQRLYLGTEPTRSTCAINHYQVPHHKTTHATINDPQLISPDIASHVRHVSPCQSEHPFSLPFPVSQRRTQTRSDDHSIAVNATPPNPTPSPFQSRFQAPVPTHLVN